MSNPASDQLIEEIKSLTDLVRVQIICNLLLEGVPQRQIQKIVKVDLNRITKIAQSLKKETRSRRQNEQ